MKSARNVITPWKTLLVNKLNKIDELPIIDMQVYCINTKQTSCVPELSVSTCARLWVFNATITPISIKSLIPKMIDSAWIFIYKTISCILYRLTKT